LTLIFKKFSKSSIKEKITNNNFDKDSIEAIKKISKLVFSGEENRIKVFEEGEKNDIHITPVHFYQPIPDTRKISPNIFDKPLHFAGIDLKEKEQIALIEKFSKYSHELENIPAHQTSNKHQYYYENEFFGKIDGIIYYSMIREFSPKRIIEVGSGFSTMIASQAAQTNDAKITSIEPYPNKILKSGLPNLDNLVTDFVQNVELDEFKKLNENDILFIDSSHIVDIGSDVNYLILHVIPELNPGVLIHFHDFFFPYEYHKEWVLKRKLFWNEMYFIWAFLISNYDYDILLSNYYMIRNHFDIFQKSFPFLQKTSGGAGSLWIKKK